MPFVVTWMDLEIIMLSKVSQNKGKVLVTQSCLTVSPWTVACQALHFMGFFQARIVDWVPIPFSQGVFLTQGIKPGSPASQADSLLSEQPREQSKSERECQILYDVICMWNLKYDTNDHSYKTEAD